MAAMAPHMATAMTVIVTMMGVAMIVMEIVTVTVTFVEGPILMAMPVPSKTESHRNTSYVMSIDIS
jgi:hypothetical protein